MPTDPSRDRFLAGANESMEKNLSRSTPAILTSYALVGLILFFGAAGYLLDRWLGTAPWLLVAGFVAAIVIGFARLYRLVRRS